jgi:anaerobic ribonucleoside-triphosphate reductase activating protein
MNYCNIKPIEIENGNHCGCSFFVSGCRNHCKGCFQPETWDFNYGNKYTEDTKNEILKILENPNIKRISILGGEPFEEENQSEVLDLILSVKKLFPKKEIWCYSGYVYDKDLIEGGRKYIDGITDKIIYNIDYLIDGPYDESKRNLTLAFRGSDNQRILKFISDGKYKVI